MAARLYTKLIIGFILFYLNGLNAQELQFNALTVPLKQELPNAQLHCLLQDPYGFIWIGTPSALAMYNGHSTTLYTPSHDMQYYAVENLFNTPDSLIFVGYNADSSLMDVLNPLTKEFFSFEAYFQEHLPFKPSEMAHVLGTVDDNKFYIKTQNGNYYQYLGNKKWQHLWQSTTAESALPRFIGNRTATQIWIHEADSLFLIETSNQRILQRQFLGPKIDIFGTHAAKELLLYKYFDDHLEFYEWNQAQLQVLDGTVPLEEIKQTNLVFNSGDRPHQYSIPQLGVIWFSESYENLIFDQYMISQQLDFKDAITAQILEGAATKASFLLNNMKGNYFFVKNESDLTIIKTSREIFKYYSPTPNQEHSTRSILMTPNKDLYVQAYTLDFPFWLQQDQTETIVNKMQVKLKERNFGLSSILSSDTSTIWMGTENAWLLKYTIATAEIDTFYPCGNRLPPTELWAFWSIHEDKKGTIWLGSQNGLYYFMPQEACFKAYDKLNEFQELTGATIWDIYENEQGIWLATSRGLYLMNPQKGILKRYHTRATAPNRLPFDQITHIYEQSDGSFWLSTKGGGLIHWNVALQTTYLYTKKDGLSNHNIHAVYEDDFGYLWMSSDYGLMCMNLKSKLVRAFFKVDGLPDNEFNLKSHYQDAAGNLYFGGLKGVIRFHPKDFIPLLQKTTANLQIIHCNKWSNTENKEIDITTSTIKTKTIHLYPTELFLNIGFALMEPYQTQQPYYAYKIDGYTKDWIETRDHHLKLSQLPYGTHTLFIKGRMAQKDWPEDYLELKIVVHAPFYKIWWFWVILLGLAAGTGIYYYRWRIRRLERQKDKLERAIQKRTQQIAADKAIIEDQAAELKQLADLKSKFFANISHELRTPLTLIKTPLQQLLEQAILEQKSSAQQLSNLKVAYKHSQKLNQLIDEILLLSKLDAQKLSVEPANIDLLFFLQEIHENFEASFNVYNFDFPFHTNIQEATYVALDYKKLERILYNLLSNAFKFTPENGKIVFDAQLEQTTLIITIEDGGRGIHADDLPHIFDRYYQSKHDAQTKQGGTGIGLALSKEFAQLLGGQLTVNSKLEVGSKFQLKLPIERVTQADPNIQHYLTMGDFTPQIIHKPEKAYQYSILLVEDSEPLRVLISNLLSSHYNIHVAIDGQDALEFLEKNPTTIDLIISDIMMPRMDGFQFTKKVKSMPKWATIPIIILSARSQQQDKLDALRIGVDDYLIKPFDASELLARVKNLLHNYQQRQLALSSTTPISTTIENTAQVQQNQWLSQVERIAFDAIKQLNGNFNLPDLTEKLDISERQFRRRIKDLVGLSPNQYLRELKLKIAKDYLEQKQYTTVKEVAFAVGFTTASHFSKLYEERFGKKPIDYLN